LAEKTVKMNLAFTFMIPTKDHVFQLGTGDMVIPLVFAASLMNAKAQALAFPFYLVSPLGVLLASLIGLILTLEYADRKRIALPALPPQTVLMVLAWVALGAAGF